MTLTYFYFEELTLRRFLACALGVICRGSLCENILGTALACNRKFLLSPKSCTREGGCTKHSSGKWSLHTTELSDGFQPFLLIAKTQASLLTLSVFADGNLNKPFPCP